MAFYLEEEGVTLPLFASFQHKIVSLPQKYHYNHTVPFCVNTICDCELYFCSLSLFRPSLDQLVAYDPSLSTLQKLHQNRISRQNQS